MPSSPLKIVNTKDGSQTVLNEELGSTYHSRHGALTESQHVFIAQGLEKMLESDMTEITILEMGFGTGLNALLTLLRTTSHNIRVNYHALELFPLSEALWREYQLPAELEAERNAFEMLHLVSWGKEVDIGPRFRLTKHHVSILAFQPSERPDLVYYDAFEPETQPELWTQGVFGNLFEWMNPNGILTTYCCKGYVRRNMIGAGFEVSKVAGPPGKREMIVAKRPL